MTQSSPYFSIRRLKIFTACLLPLLMFVAPMAPLAASVNRTNAARNHFVTAYSDDPADVSVPGPLTVLGLAQALMPYRPQADPNVTMNFNEVTIAGGSHPHNNMMPYLTVTFMIAMKGVFPPLG